MRHWKNGLIAPGASVSSAVQAIDQSGVQIALVVDEGGALIGTVTDGDVRRALLRGVSLEAIVAGVMNPNPVTARPEDSPHAILRLMQETELRCIPVIDVNRRVLRVASLNELMQPPRRQNAVLIMAGGIGSRLRPLTDDCPKPMLKVGTKPILETILESLLEFGFARFFLSVNYRSDMVKNHFGDGSRWGVAIEYLEENAKLGTAGALGLIEAELTHPIVVMNGDLLTKVNFGQLLDFHTGHRAAATMCVREYDMQVPYGVVSVDDHKICGIDEKPIHRFFVNAGIYVLEPSVVRLVRREMHLDMTALFEQLIGDGQETAAFPIHEYWVDVGQLEDLERARVEYDRLFGLSTGEKS